MAPFFKNASYGINEYRRAFQSTISKTLQKLIPSLEMKDIKPEGWVRALLLGKDGDTRDDFRIEYGK